MYVMNAKIIGLLVVALAVFACSSQQELTAEEYAEEFCRSSSAAGGSALTVGEAVVHLRDQVKQMESLTPPEQYLQWHNEMVGQFKHVLLKKLEEFDEDEPFTISLLLGAVLVESMAAGQIIDQLEQEMTRADRQILADAGCNVEVDADA